MLQVRYEQAVYGSFPFWDRGYGALANSPGCRPEWLAAFERACQRFGEPTPGSCPDGAVFALRLGRGPWAVVGVSSSGLDDRGRPGALAFHALFVAARDLMRCPRGPFDLVPALRKDWGPQTTLTGAMIEVDDTSASPSALVPDASPPVDEPGMDRAVRIVKALGPRARRRVALESASPLNDLACAVWLRAGDDLRKRLSIATLAYSNDNHFTLVTLPKLASAELGPDYLTPDQVDAGTAPVSAEADTSSVGAQSRRLGPSSRKVAMIGAASVALVGVGLGSLAVSRGRERRTPSESSVTPVRMARAVSAPPRPPAPALEIAGPAAHADEDIKARVAEGLLDLAERFNLADSVPPDAIASPTALMRHVATNLRYKGPWLTDEQRSRLRDDGGEEARRALEWDAHLSHFAAERPLPEGFDSGPLDWQLRTLAWSFGVGPHPDLVATELPFALAESLALPGGAPRSLRLEAEYPALDPYARFLSRLPRR
jgi:hypothetical protein